MFKRVSTLNIPEPERMEQSFTSGSRSGGKVKVTLATVTRGRPIPLPVRSSRPSSRAQQAGMAAPKSTARSPALGSSRQLYPQRAARSPALGSSRQLYPQRAARSPALGSSCQLYPQWAARSSAAAPSRQLYSCTSLMPVTDMSVLDGIGTLPPGSEQKRVLRSSSKKRKQVAASDSASRIPHPRNGQTKSLRKTLLKKKEEVSSPSTLNSTAAFEANELAMTSSTPGVTSRAASSTAADRCCNLAEILQEAKKLHEGWLKENKELVSEQKQLVSEQKQFLYEQKQLMQQQRQLVDLEIGVLSEIRTLLRSQNGSASVAEDGDVVMASEEGEKENQNVCRDVNNGASSSNHTGEASNVVPKALKQYNDIRAGFNCLSLRTPRITRTGRVAPTPKTPKSILSMTLQHQLGDLFDESN